MVAHLNDLQARRALLEIASLIERQELKIAVLRSLLLQAAERFREYERLHAAKPDPEKARRNAEMAELCEAGLSDA